MSDVSNRFGECHTTSELKDQMRGTNVNLLVGMVFVARMRAGASARDVSRKSTRTTAEVQLRLPTFMAIDVWVARVDQCPFSEWPGTNSLQASSPRT